MKLSRNANMNLAKCISLSAFLIAGCGAVNDKAPSTTSATAGTTIDFHIAAGTAKKSWNTRETIVVAHVGDIVRIINDDSIDHILHTNGAPCPHGSNIKPGASFNCVISKVFDPGNKPLYDHNVGPTAEFWIKAEL